MLMLKTIYIIKIMISYSSGDLFASKSFAIVNTVNTVGVMGKGVALRFKELFPDNFVQYKEACKNKTLSVGNLLVVRSVSEQMGERLIINFPTKVHWRNPSKYEYIEEGLKELRDVILSMDLKEIAMPPLGCGNGGLDWNIVKGLIESYLGDLDGVSIIVYEPGKDYQQAIKQERREVKLTDCRAMLLYSLFCYEMYDERTNLVVANKLSYFFQMVGEPAFAKMKFSANHYGPFSTSVAYVLKETNGKFLHGLEEMEAKPFDELELDYAHKQEVSDYIHNLPTIKQDAIKKVLRILSGFESTFAIEILATVAFIRNNNKGISLADTITAVRNWSERKAKLFSEENIRMAYEHLDAVL